MVAPNAGVAISTGLIQAGPRAMWFMLSTWLQGVVNLFTPIIEMPWRPRFGSRYYHPIAVFLQALFVEILGVLDVLFGGMTGRGLIGMGTIALLFRLGCIAYAGRIVWLLSDMSRELDSELDGPGWQFWERLPKGGAWGWVRIAYEPGITLVAVIVLGVFGVLSGIAALYLAVCCLMTSIKAALMLWDVTELERTALDASARSEWAKAVLSGNRQPKGYVPLHAMPEDVTYQMRIDLARRMTRRMKPELQNLVSPVEAQNA